MTTPVVTVNTGHHAHLKMMAAQNSSVLKNSKLILLGDETNCNNPYVLHFDIKDYYKSADAFESKYVHLSFQVLNYERFCFSRWFILRDFVRKNGFQDDEPIVYLDPDVLIYTDVANYARTLFGNRNLKLATCENGWPPFTFFRDISVLDEYCSYIMDFYTDESKKDGLVKRFSEYRKTNTAGGISDMYLLRQFGESLGDLTYNLSKVDVQGRCFDSNVNKADGYQTNPHQGCIKRLSQVGNDIVGIRESDGLKVRFLGVHFQGWAKAYISFYITADLVMALRFQGYLFFLFKRIQRKIVGYKRRIMRIFS